MIDDDDNDDNDDDDEIDDEIETLSVGDGSNNSKVIRHIEKNMIFESVIKKNYFKRIFFSHCCR